MLKLSIVFNKFNIGRRRVYIENYPKRSGF